MDDIERFAKHLPEDLYIEMSSGDNVSLGLVMNRKATKWNAVQAVSEHFNIPTADIVAFGDDYNDVEMLRGCGIGVAVANAINEAKSVADHICDTNENDGVAKWLEENVL
jgi:hydroxymethylpyrimidine pyrophosphatase-like HAD family hydrolase